MKVIIILLIAIFFLYKKVKNLKENESKNTCESDVFDSSYFDEIVHIQDEPGEIIDSLAEKEGVEMISEEEIMGLGEEEKRKFSLRDAIIYSTILDRPYK
ncbi:MAG: hypothetical protein UIG52_04020 [Bacteroidales bacterium]|nr:hypothetical protein [Bacteroidales bacterium]